MLSTCVFYYFKLYILILVICFAGYGDKADATASGDNQEESNDLVSDQKSDNEDPNDSGETDAVTAKNEESFHPGDTENDENLDENSAGDENTGQDENDQHPPSTGPDIIYNVSDPCNTNFRFIPINQQKSTGLKLSADKITKFKLWPEAIIPFHIDKVSYDKVLRDKIISYLEDASSATGLTFQELADPPEDENERWVFFVNRRGILECKDYSTNSFTNSGVQKVILGYDCLNNLGPIAAVVLALAGVPPQHNAPNRDQYIAVSMDSIIPDKRGLFKRLNDADWLFNKLDYDFDSVGHYPSFKYTVDGSATIKKIKQSPADDSPTKIPHVTVENENFSCRDLEKIKILYYYPSAKRPRKNIKLEECKALFKPVSDADLKSRGTPNNTGVPLSSPEI